HEESDEVHKRQEDIINILQTTETEELIDQTMEWEEFLVEEVFNEYNKGNEDEAFDNMLMSEEYVDTLATNYEELASNRENRITTFEENILADGQKTITIVAIISIIVILIS